jgi:multidrug resistance efflux pump
VAEARLHQVSAEIPATGASLAVSGLQAERTFQSEIEAAQVEVQSARASAATDQAELAHTAQELDQQRSLVKRGLMKADGLTELELRRTALEQAVRTWPGRVDAIETRHRAAVARLAEWRRTNSEQPGGSRKAQLQPIYGKVREQQESIRLLRTQLRNTVLRAPSDAYVSSILARPGDVIRPGDPILLLVEAEPRQVIAYIDERNGAALASGVKVKARRRDASRSEFPATVAAVAGNVTQLPLRLWTSPTVPAWGRAVYVQLPPQARLDPGEIVDLRVAPDGPAEDKPLTASRN